MCIYLAEKQQNWFYKNKGVVGRKNLPDPLLDCTS